MDAAVTVAVQLVNTLTPGAAYGRDHTVPDGTRRRDETTAILRETVPGQPALTAAQAASFAVVARELRVVFERVAAEDMDAAAHQVNRLLLETGARPQLARHDGEPWHLHFHGLDDELVTQWAAGCATGLAVVLGSELAHRIGVCTAPRCDRVYVDTSRNGTRRYCGTACQNRVKAAAFRARKDGTAGRPAAHRS
jgi:predicted RNA-binding Zn ribbon-like protein